MMAPKTADPTTEPGAQLLYQMLDDTHPKMVEALYIAAISPWYDLPFFAAVRDDDDDRDAALLPRLTRYSFVVTTPTEGGETLYSVRADERAWLQRHWIDHDPDAFRAAHQRAYAYRHTHPDPVNPDAHAQNELYHLFFADFNAAMDRLSDLFRIYFTERRLTAIERLLATADEAYTYLILLDQPDLHQLDNLLIHLDNRLAQLRGHWQDSLEPLSQLLEDPQLSADLAPYVIRAYGLGLSQTGQYVEAIEQLKFALAEFTQRAETAESSPILPAEQGYTMIALGDAYVALAVQARGYSQNVSILQFGRLQILRDLFNFFLSFPLVLFLTFYLGYRVWLPQFWPVYEHLDWIIARLFAVAARYYKKADPLLESHAELNQPSNQTATPSLDYIPRQESVFADEKLALLYLQMGAYHQARELFEYLLTEEEAPLGDFRRASVRVGLAQALVQLNEPQLARNHLEQAMTVLEFYEETALQAIARAVMGQALLEIGATTHDEANPTAAIYHLAEAMQLHEAQGQWVKATEVSEYLLSLIQTSKYGLTADQKEDARQTAETLITRHYPMPYRNSVTVLFRRLVLVLLAIVVFFIMPMSTIKLDIGTNTVPQITFQASPLLDPGNADFTPDLMQGVSALNLADPPNPDVLVTLGAQLFFGYLLLSTGLGLLAMLITPLRQVQQAGAAQVVRLDEQGVRVGQGWTQRSINWPEITRFIEADVRLFRGWLPDTSYSVLQSAARLIFIRGSAAWYPSLRDRLAAKSPPQAEQVRLSHTIIRSPMGVLFVLTAVLLLFISIMGSLAPQAIPVDWLGPYSLADIYPYVYLGFFLPMTWWFIVQPLRKRWLVQPATTPAYAAGAIGLFLAFVRLFTRFRPWLTIPDIYPDLLIAGLVAASSLIIWRARTQNGRTAYPNWLRWLSAVIASIIALFMMAHLGQVVVAYHYLVVGNHLRDVAATEAEPDNTAEAALQAYQRALDIAEIKLLGLIPTHKPVPYAWGIPKPHEFIWLLAKSGKAAMSSQLGNYDTAIADYTELLASTDDPAKVYVSRAIAYQGLAAQSEGTTADQSADSFTQQENINIKAIADYNTAIQLAPNNADYYLWRGVAYHSLGDLDQAEADYQKALSIQAASQNEALNDRGRSQALTGLGWAEYSKGNYDRALEYFNDASAADPDSAEAPLGQGYAYYSLRDYDQALDVWQTAVSQDSDNPITYISLGTLYWRVGTLGDNYNKLGGNDRCSQEFLTDEQKTHTAESLETSIANLEQSLTLPQQTDADKAFTYRTIGQVQSLLQNCPGYEPAAVLQDVVNSYEKATELDPTNPTYWHNKARFSYSVWKNLPPATDLAAREWLFAGLADNEMALALNNVDNPGRGYQPNEWENVILRAIGSTLMRGDQRYRDGDYVTALAYYELMATNQPDNTTAAFKAGLAALALGDQAAANEWYQQGEARAAQQNQPDLVREYRRKWQIYAAFAEALTAVRNQQWAQMGELYDEALQQAAQAQALEVVQAAASDLRDYLLANPNVEIRQAYWPLQYDTPVRRSAGQAWSDLYWRYRMEFGYQLLQGMFFAQPGREREYEAILASITADIERAAALNEAAHGAQAETLANSNIGRLYVQRGDAYFAAQDYDLALADYEQALNRLSDNNLSEVTQATFKAALTAVARNDMTTAATWYDQGTQQAAQLQTTSLVQTAAATLGEFLLARDDGTTPTAVYWPLQYSSPDLDEATPRDLYWRYRAEFGWQLISTLFNQMPGVEAELEQIFAAALNDLERAADLDAKHSARRDYLAATNMGNFYLQRGQLRYQGEQLAAAQADFEQALNRLRADNPATSNDLIQASFWAGLTALVQGDYGRAADWHNQGLASAAANSDSGSVLDAANRLATALQENPSLDLAAAYWPLSEARGDRETAVSSLDNPDLYWRYRAEFGFRLISRLFQASSGDEAQYETMFDEVIKDIETAYALNPAAHQTRRNFFVDANIGWHYLRRGKEHLTAGRYQPALADLTQATQRIQPNSPDARNDYLDALFSAGLAELALGNFAQAQEWYRQGVSLAGQQDQNSLGQAGEQLERLLFGRSLDG